MKIAAVAHDPGGASAVAAAIAALRADGLAVEAHAKGPAARRMAELGVFCHAFEGPHAAVVAALDADLLLAGTSAVDGFELDAIGAVAARGIPTLAVLDYPANYASRFRRGNPGRPVWPDIVTAIDRPSAASMIEDGIPADRIRLLGQPYFAWLLRRPCRPARGGFRRRILFASQPGAHEVEALAMVADGIRRLARPVGLTLRFHPRQLDRAASLASLERAGVPAELDDDTPTLACLEAHDLVLGISSTILIEAALIGRPTASVLAGPVDDPLATLRAELIPALRSPEAIERFIESAPSPPAESTFARAQRNADRRVADLCRTLLGRSGDLR